MGRAVAALSPLQQLLWVSTTRRRSSQSAAMEWWCSERRCRWGSRAGRARWRCCAVEMGARLAGASRATSGPLFASGSAPPRDAHRVFPATAVPQLPRPHRHRTPTPAPGSLRPAAPRILVHPPHRLRLPRPLASAQKQRDADLQGPRRGAEGPRGPAQRARPRRPVGARSRRGGARRRWRQAQGQRTPGARPIADARY
jgi:hypothetical protein